MRLGLVTPVVTLVPHAHAPWERDAGWEDVVRIAEAADRLGFDHLTCAEHVAIPAEVAETRGSRYWDPLATLGFLASVTDTVRLATSVLVLGYHHPLEIAKRYGTLDQVSGGRLVLGVGVGSLEAEFDILGAPFAGRGEQADDALGALRASLSSTRPSYDGTHYRFDDVVLDPSALQSHVPIWVGGRTARSLRRAVELADGWCPFGLTADEMASMLARAADTEAWRRRTSPLELVLQSPRAFDPIGDRSRAATMAAGLAEVGATILSVRLVSRSAEHFIDQMAAMADLVDPM